MMMNHHAPPFAVNQQRVSEVDSNCWAIVRELCESGQYATLEKVLTVLLQRYGVQDFSQLMCGDFTGIPTLSLLMELNKKIGTFLTSNLAMASIVTVADLEWDCVQYLQSFEVPTLYSLHTDSSQPTVHAGSENTGGDPNEVDLDDLDTTDHTNNTEHAEHAEQLTEYTEEHSAVTCFADYGVGHLLHQPIVWSYFSHYTPPEQSEDCCTTEHVMQILIEYLSEQKRQPGNKFSTFAVDDFIAYLCTELSISHPVEAGILVRGNLHAERLALEHVVSNRYTLYVETTKRELVHFNQQMAMFQDTGRKTNKKRRKRNQEEETADTVDTDDVVVDAVVSEDKVGEEKGEERGDRSTTVVVSEVVEEVCTEVSTEPSVVVDAVVEVEVTVANTASNGKSEPELEPNATKLTTTVTNTTTSTITNTNTTNTAHTTTTTTATTASTTNTSSTTKRTTTPYEGSMNVYLPSGQPSVTSTGAFRCGAHSENADTGIRIVENWELQSILPYVDINDVHNTYGGSVGVSSVDVSGTVHGSTCYGDNNMHVPGSYGNINIHNGQYYPPNPPNPHTSHNTNTNYPTAPYTTSTTHIPTITSTTNTTNTFNTGLDSRTAGRWGEALIYQYLLSTAAPGTKVNWLNQQEETRACYDFIVHAPIRGNNTQVAASRMHYNQTSDSSSSGCGVGNTSTSTSSSCTTGRESTEYIEVKSTRFADRNMFEISLNEWQFAAADSRVPYHIYRVFSAGDPQRVRLVIIEDVFRKVSEGRLKLCMAV